MVETSGVKNIADMWKGNYSNVFNSVTNTEVEEYISSEVDVESINGCVSEIVEAIKYLPHNKSPGHDSVMSEHFQYASHWLPVLLAALFKSILQHDITSTGNYRPVALATVCSKIMIMIISIQDGTLN